MALFFPYLIKSEREDALPNTLGFPVIPKQIAHTNVDLPVPFGPITTFKLAPGKNSSESYVLVKIMYRKPFLNKVIFEDLLT